ncbi:hypothetical protein AB0B18_15665 [Micromonospora chalcea]
MSIIASAPVPAGSRLVDADTIDLAAIRRQTGERFPVNPSYRAAVDRGLCPTWCTQDHSDDGEERLHSSAAVEVRVGHGVDLLDTLTVTVAVDAFESPCLPGGIDPASIYLSAVADKSAEAQVTGNLSAEQAEQLAVALLAAARTARQARTR